MMKYPFASLLAATILLTVGASSGEAQVRFQLNFGGGGDWCGPFRHHYDHYDRAPIFSPWSPAGYLPYHDPYHDPYHSTVSRIVVPSISYSVAPSTRYVIPSSPSARVASSRPIYSSRRPTNTGELVSAFQAQAKDDFRFGDYDNALENLNEALGVTPNDTSLRQLKALGLFAQGRYDEASGLVKPLVDSGAAWDWNTMIAHYPSEDVYERQFRRLEHHVDTNPNLADPRFLLGYHYQVGGHLSAATMMFEQASRPAVATAPEPPKPALKTPPRPAEPKKVSEATMAAVASPPAIEKTEPDPAPSLAGSWRSVTGDGDTITLEIGSDGKFSWEYEGAPPESMLSGDWALGDDGKLNLADKDVPLSGSVEMEGVNTMRFVLDGTPEGDPGLVFERM